MTERALPKLLQTFGVLWREAFGCVANEEMEQRIVCGGDRSAQTGLSGFFSSRLARCPACSSRSSGYPIRLSNFRNVDVRPAARPQRQNPILQVVREFSQFSHLLRGWVIVFRHLKANPDRRVSGVIFSDLKLVFLDVRWPFPPEVVEDIRNRFSSGSAATLVLLAIVSL